jgi:uncharacterized membrane protein YdjX (TVP38/TMEM64 family)
MQLFHLGDYLTLSYIRASRESFALLYSEHPFPLIAAYVSIYIVVTSLSLPGAAIMTLAGGALFGLYTGTLVVSFASSIGATLACLVSRFLLRDWVRARFGDKLTAITRGIEREGAFYLFTLRLVPVFPFWLINLLMGLTAMPLRTFYWVSQLGMLPATIVYVNAGGELSKIDSVSGILSPRLVLSFTVLGLFPFVAKKLVGFYKTQKESSSRR